MYMINEKQKKMLEVINGLGSIEKSQLFKLTDLKENIRNLELLERLAENRYIKKEGNVIYPFFTKMANENMFKCIKVLIYIMDTYKDVIWYQKANSPIELILYRNEKVYDVVYIKRNEEVLMSVAINNSSSERVIVLLEDLESMKKISINKKVMFCVLEPEIRFIG